MFVASFVAVFETNLKRMLAYSSVAQIGYITLGIGLANQAGLTGGLVHLVNHALMKAALFLAVGAIFFRVGTVRLSDLAGIGRNMPITMAAFTIAGFGTRRHAGHRPASSPSGTWRSARSRRAGGSLVFLIVASSLIALVYVGRVLEVVWLREPLPAIAQASDPPLSMLLPIIVLAAATIYFGIDTEWTAGIGRQGRQEPAGGLR